MHKPWLAVLWLAGCGASSHAPTAEEIASFARDSMPLDSLTGYPSDSAFARLFVMLGVARDTIPVTAGCSLGGDSDSVPRVQQVTCVMRAGERLEVELSQDSTGTAIRAGAVGAEVQEYALEETEPFDPSDVYLSATDLDGDGTRELMIRQLRGGTGNTAFQVFRYVTLTNRIAPDAPLSAMPNLARIPGWPCVWHGWHGGGADRANLISCIRDGTRLDAWAKIEQPDSATGRTLRMIHVLQGDSLQVVRTDTVAAND